MHAYIHPSTHSNQLRLNTHACGNTQNTYPQLDSDLQEHLVVSPRPLAPFHRDQDGDKFHKIPECYIRGNNIKYLRVPDEVIDKVQEEPRSEFDASHSTAPLFLPCTISGIFPFPLSLTVSYSFLFFQRRGRTSSGGAAEAAEVWGGAAEGGAAVKREGEVKGEGGGEGVMVGAGEGGQEGGEEGVEEAGAGVLGGAIRLMRQKSCGTQLGGG